VKISLTHKSQRGAPLLDRAFKFFKRGSVTHRIGDQIDRSDHQRDDPPWPQQQIFHLKVPEVLAHAGFAHPRIHFACLSEEQHSNVAIVFHWAGLPHASAKLAFTNGISDIDGAGGGHKALLGSGLAARSNERSMYWHDTYTMRATTAQSGAKDFHPVGQPSIEHISSYDFGAAYRKVPKYVGSMVGDKGLEPLTSPV
jgi:hypothetical protein